MSQPPHRASARNARIRTNDNSANRRSIGSTRRRLPAATLSRFSNSAKIHWLEIATGVLVLALVTIQVMRPGVAPRIDPRALLPAIDPIALGRAAIERITPPAFAAREADLPQIAPAASSVAAAPAFSAQLPAEPTRANTAAPRRTGYVEGYAQLDLGGSSIVTIDNRANDADVFVNLVRLGDRDSLATRVVIIAAGDRFNIAGVQRGRYELRYRDLLTGIMDRTDPFVLTERRTRQGVGDGRVVIAIGDRRN